MVGDVAGVYHGDDGIERDPRAQISSSMKDWMTGAGFAGRCPEQAVKERCLACAQESGENRRRYLVHRCRPASTNRVEFDRIEGDARLAGNMLKASDSAKGAAKTDKPEQFGRA